jgi:nucleoside-diphosphate-sugar epimerase
VRLDVNDPDSLAKLSEFISSDMVVLHSVPVPGVVSALRKNPPRRVVYLSTTGVYGAAKSVDEHTTVAPRTEREQLRVSEEREVLSGPWQSMVLRPAAIYGPGRGIHTSMRDGKYQLMGDGGNYVSRIHVDDLAHLAEAAMMSGIAGAYPVADDEPCTSREIAGYCAKLLNIPMPPAASPESLGETRRADRRVDGSAIRRLLGINLKYPSYREGIAACLEAEARALSTS